MMDDRHQIIQRLVTIFQNHVVGGENKLMEEELEIRVGLFDNKNGDHFTFEAGYRPEHKDMSSRLGYSLKKCVELEPTRWRCHMSTQYMISYYQTRFGEVRRFHPQRPELPLPQIKTRKQVIDIETSMPYHLRIGCSQEQTLSPEQIAELNETAFKSEPQTLCYIQCFSFIEKIESSTGKMFEFRYDIKKVGPRAALKIDAADKNKPCFYHAEIELLTWPVVELDDLNWLAQQFLDRAVGLLGTHHRPRPDAPFVRVPRVSLYEKRTQLLDPNGNQPSNGSIHVSTIGSEQNSQLSTQST